MKILAGIKNLLGGKDGLGSQVVDLFSKKIPDKDLAAQLAHDVEVLFERNSHEIDKLELEVEMDYEREVTKRVEAEQSSNDTYTKRTRPHIARMSFYSGTGYIFLHVLTTVVSPYVQVDVYDAALMMMVPAVGPIVPLYPTLLGMIFSPALTYMGVRTFDKWSAAKNGSR